MFNQGGYLCFLNKVWTTATPCPHLGSIDPIQILFPFILFGLTWAGSALYLSQSWICQRAGAHHWKPPPSRATKTRTCSESAPGFDPRKKTVGRFTSLLRQGQKVGLEARLSAEFAICALLHKMICCFCSSSRSLSETQIEVAQLHSCARIPPPLPKTGCKLQQKCEKNTIKFSISHPDRNFHIAVGEQFVRRHSARDPHFICQQKSGQFRMKEAF